MATSRRVCCCVIFVVYRRTGTTRRRTATELGTHRNAAHRIRCERTFTRLLKLDKFWQDQPIIFDFKAEIQGTGSRSWSAVRVVELGFKNLGFKKFLTPKNNLGF